MGHLGQKNPKRHTVNEGQAMGWKKRGLCALSNAVTCDNSFARVFASIGAVYISTPLYPPTFRREALFTVSTLALASRGTCNHSAVVRRFPSVQQSGGRAVSAVLAKGLRCAKRFRGSINPHRHRRIGETNSRQTPRRTSS